MSRIANILTRARDTLADPTGQRWSDERLLRLVSEAQQDIAKHTQMLKSQVDIPLIPGQRTYTLPRNLWIITRASFDGLALSLVTHEQLDFTARKQATSSYNTEERESSYGDFDDVRDVSWETDTSSTIEALIYDKRNLSEVHLYPIPSDEIANNSYIFETEDEVDFAGGELYGVVTGIDNYTLNSHFGVIADLYDPFVENENFISDFGVVTGINESEGTVHIWYVYTPDELTSIDDTLVIPQMWDTAIKNYVVGQAFNDDYDTRFAEKSQRALAMYDRELNISKEFERKNNVRSGHRKTQYRGAFDK